MKRLATRAGASALRSGMLLSRPVDREGQAIRGTLEEAIPTPILSRTTAAARLPELLHIAIPEIAGLRTPVRQRKDIRQRRID